MSEARKDRAMVQAFGARLTALRIAKGYRSAADASIALRLEPGRYRKYERGDAVPPPYLLRTLCDALETTADFLLLGRDAR